MLRLFCKIIFLTAWYIPVSATLSAQNLFPLKDDTAGFCIQADASFLASNDSKFSHLNYFILFQYSTEQLRKKMDNSLSDEKLNLLGSLLSYSLSTSVKFSENSRYRIIAGYNLQNFQKITITGKAFHLFRDGNYDFAGQNLDLSGIYYKVRGLNTFSLGLKRNFFSEKNKMFAAGLMVNFYSESVFNQLSFHDASLYTSPEGDSLQFTGKVTYMGAQNRKLLWSDHSGEGISATVTIEWKPDSKQRLLLDFQSPGILWHSLRKSEIDTIFKYTGIDIFNGEEFNLSSNPLHFIDSFINDQEDLVRTSSVLPIRFSFQYIAKINQSFQFHFLINYYPDLSKLPLMRAEISRFFINNVLRLSGGLNRDYFGHFGFSGSLELKLKNWLFSLNSLHIQSLFPGEGIGQSAVFSLKKSF